MTGPAVATDVAADRPWSLTPRQRQCMQVLQELYDATGMAPSYDELCIELELASKSGVHRLMIELQRRGWIEQAYGKKRAIRILRRVPMPDFTPPEFLLAPDLLAGG